MPNEVNVERRAADFLYPPQTLIQKARSLLANIPSAEAVAYTEGIDESKYQYSTTRKVDHAAALAGGVGFTVVRVSNCVTADPYFEQAWTDAMAAGMPVMVYANVQGYKSGLEQAEFAMRTAEPFIAACKHKVVIWGDFEADGLTMTIAARQKIALDFLNGIHAHYETGNYSNVKYWGEMYGNLKPPAWAWLWGAHWTNVQPQYPASWDLSKLLIWQYGVWNNQTWALPVPGNVPDIDKDRWVWAGGDVNTFLKLDVIPVPPPPPVPDYDKQIAQLQAETASLRECYDEVRADMTELNRRIETIGIRLIGLENAYGDFEKRITALEDKQTGAGTYFLVMANVANARHAPTDNKQGYPIMVIYPRNSTTGRIQFKAGDRVPIHPGWVDADGSLAYCELVQLAPNGDKLYLRAIDGRLE